LAVGSTRQYLTKCRGGHAWIRTQRVGLTLDSQEPMEGDLPAVLDTLRQRLAGGCCRKERAARNSDSRR
jgi:hypothetical protein